MENFNEIIDKVMNKEKSLSFSSLKAFLQSPKHYYAYNMEKETTKAMEEGTQFHMAILEPEKFKENYWVLDDIDICTSIGGSKPRATNKYKEWLSEEYSKHSGQMISSETYNSFIKMGEYLSKNTATKDLMNGLIHKELSIDFEEQGFNITGKIDGVGELNGEKYTIDLKKVANSDYSKLRYIIKDMKYDMQGAIYAASQMCSTHYLICIDMSCNVTVVKIGKDALEKGYDMFRFALDSFRSCAEQDLWHSSYEFYNGGYIEFN